MKSRRSKACDIPKKVKDRVWERDNGRCVVCGDWRAMPNAHYINRAQGGLGIEQNIVTLCAKCHFSYDHTSERPVMRERIKAYLKECYPDWNEADLYYKKEW